jgi:hypothetical protein
MKKEKKKKKCNFSNNGQSQHVFPKLWSTLVIFALRETCVTVTLVILALRWFIKWYEYTYKEYSFLLCVKYVK